MGGRKKKSVRTSYPLLNPDPGPWALDWSLADHEGPFPWPQPRCEEFYLLAGYLARLNRLPLDEVFALERAHGRGSAIHALAEEGLSTPAEERWAHLIEAHGLDDPSKPQLDIVTMTYCIEHVDARRVVVGFDGQTRTMYPLWWDQNHEVSGSNGSQQVPQPCESDDCHHHPWSA